MREREMNFEKKYYCLAKTSHSDWRIRKDNEFKKLMKGADIRDYSSNIELNVNGEQHNRLDSYVGKKRKKRERERRRERYGNTTYLKI